LARRLPPGWCLWPENPIAVDRTNAPLPGMMLVRGEPQDYARARRHPGPGDVGLFVEVAVTSLPKDLGRNVDLYARALVLGYWVVDVLGHRIFAYAGPETVNGRPQFDRADIVLPGQTLPLVLDGQEIAKIAFEELFPWEPMPS
jgi:hypothetical protein